jgi:hypothetical protein
LDDSEILWPMKQAKSGVTPARTEFLHCPPVKLQIEAVWNKHGFFFVGP